MTARRKKIVVVASIAAAALIVIMLLCSMFVSALSEPNNTIRRTDPIPPVGRSHGNMWLLNNGRDLTDAATGNIVFDHSNPKAPDTLVEAVAVLNPEVENKSKPSTSIGPSVRSDQNAEYVYSVFKDGLRYDVQFLFQKLYNFSDRGRGKLHTEAVGEIIDKYDSDWDKIINEAPAYLYNTGKLDWFDEQTELFIKDLDEQYELTDELLILEQYESSDYRIAPKDESSFPLGIIRPSDGLHGGHFIELVKRDENGNVIDTHRLRLECFFQDVIPEEVPGVPEDDNPPPPSETTTTTTTVTTKPTTPTESTTTPTSTPDKKDINKGLNGTDMSHSPDERYIGSEVPDQNIDAKTDLQRFTGVAATTTTTTTAATQQQAATEASKTSREPQRNTEVTTAAVVPESPTGPVTKEVTQPAVIETSPSLDPNYQPATAPADQTNRFIPSGEYKDDGY